MGGGLLVLRSEIQLEKGLLTLHNRTIVGSIGGLGSHYNLLFKFTFERKKSVHSDSTSSFTVHEQPKG